MCPGHKLAKMLYPCNLSSISAFLPKMGPIFTKKCAISVSCAGIRLRKSYPGSSGDVGISIDAHFCDGVELLTGCPSATARDTPLETYQLIFYSMRLCSLLMGLVLGAHARSAPAESGHAITLRPCLKSTPTHQLTHKRFRPMCSRAWAIRS